MRELIFIEPGRGLTIGEIAALTGAEPPTGAAATRRIVSIAPLDRAGPSDLSFFDNRRFGGAAQATHAGACLTSAVLAHDLPADVTKLIVGEPYKAFVAAARALFPDALRPSSLYAGSSAEGAHVDPTARLETGVVIEPGAVVGPRAAIGSGTLIASNAVIAGGVHIGRECAIGASSIISNALIGDRVIIHPGCCIGQDGFGYLAVEKDHLKIPQVGRVIIQDDVEIGAGTTIDRGAICDTVIGEGTKIDNLVQVGHNAMIGRHCVVVAQTGISGNSTIEDFAVVKADVGLDDNVAVGEGAR
jgi:UDP-3-O-[3-hydroxymyristoyl] glucosamine N-acyltransferase